MVIFPFRKLMFACSFSALLVFSQTSFAETINDSVGAALTHHPSVESAKAALMAADEEEDAAFSNYFPELSLSASGGRLYGDNSTSRGLSVTRGTGYSGTWEASINARQMIFDGFETPNRVSSAEARFNAADMNVADVQERIALRAAQAYGDVLRTRIGVQILESHIGKVENYLKRIRSAVDQGAADETELQQARDASIMMSGLLAQYQADAKNAEANFYEAMGYFPPAQLAKPSAPVSYMPLNLEEALTAVAAHPSLRAAAFTSDSAGYDIHAEEASLYPDLNAETAYLKSEKRDVLGGEVVDARATVRMNWSFQTGGAQLSRIKQKKYEYEDAKARVKELERQIETQVRMAHAGLDLAKSRYENEKTRQALNEKLVDTYQVQFEGGRVSLLQLMQADNQLVSAKLEAVNSEYGVLAASYALLANMGRLQDALATSEDMGIGQNSSDQLSAVEAVAGYSDHEQN